MTPTASPVDILKWLRTTNRSRTLTPAEKSIAVEIASRINSGTGICFPSLQTIADAVGLCLSLVKRAVRKLIEMGMLAVRHTGRSNIYSLRGLPGCTSDSHERRPRRTKSTNETPPLPPEGQESIEIEATQATDPTPAPPTAPAADPTPADDTPEPENPADAQPDAADEAQAVIIALIAASGAQYSTKPGSGPMRAAEKALKVATVEDLKLVIAWCASTWSNPKFLTPSAVLRVDRLDERVAAAKAAAPAGTRQQAHKLFEREKPIERAKPETVASHLAGLKAALGGRLVA